MNKKGDRSGMTVLDFLGMISPFLLGIVVVGFVIVFSTMIVMDVFF